MKYGAILQFVPCTKKNLRRLKLRLRRLRVTLILMIQTGSSCASDAGPLKHRSPFGFRSARDQPSSATFQFFPLIKVFVNDGSFRQIE